MRIAVSGRHACAYIYEHRAQRVKIIPKVMATPALHQYFDTSEGANGLTQIVNHTKKVC